MIITKFGRKIRITKKVIWNAIESLKKNIGDEGYLESVSERIDKREDENISLRRSFKDLLNYLGIEWLKDENGYDKFQPKKKGKK